ncbi:hypothetical protein [Bradyrhizobium neotropicale]|nr:hypothetical protein [Bradyrhizobium neotropicale]MBO4221927.1 hypothetical protein [Bradyrhizobium neotropicale]
MPVTDENRRVLLTMEEIIENFMHDYDCSREQAIELFEEFAQEHPGEPIH